MQQGVAQVGVQHNTCSFDCPRNSHSQHPLNTRRPESHDCFSCTCWKTCHALDDALRWCAGWQHASPPRPGYSAKSLRSVAAVASAAACVPRTRAGLGLLQKVCLSVARGIEPCERMRWENVDVLLQCGIILRHSSTCLARAARTRQGMEKKGPRWCRYLGAEGGHARDGWLKRCLKIVRLETQ